MFLFVLRPSQYLEGWFDNLQDNPLLRYAAKLNNDVKALPEMSIFCQSGIEIARCYFSATVKSDIE